jgi:TDG/mug DNA glycosylase family protein
VDRRTVAIYERQAEDYLHRRPPRDQPAARRFARRVPAGVIRLDLGSGPGIYTSDLGRPVVALDAAQAMLDLVARRAPGAFRVRADLEALPLRPGGAGAAWARMSYQHIPRPRLPGALAQLHRALRVGAPVSITVEAGTGRERRSCDDLPGRLFARWDGHSFGRVLVGAGFMVQRVDHDGDHLRADAARLRTLPDLVAPGMRLLVCGLNPSLYAADAGIPFARPGNRFWPAARVAGLVTVERDPQHAVEHHGVGFTDLVKRATVRAHDIAPSEYRDGLERVRWMVEWIRPRLIVFVGLGGWRAAVDASARPGLQTERFGGARAYVMPSTSGLNGHASLEVLTAHLRAAAHAAAGEERTSRRSRVHTRH